MSDHFVRLLKEVEIPFTPTLGIELHEGRWFSGRIERVIWDSDEQVFTVVSAGDVIREGDVDAIVEHHLWLGWQVAPENS